MSIPKAPAGLQARGRSFWRAIQAKYAPSEAEAELLLEICRLLDQLDGLERAAHPIVVAGSSGQPRTHPALAEMRFARHQLAALLSQLRIEDASIATAYSARARKAANARWRPSIVEGGKPDAPS